MTITSEMLQCATFVSRFKKISHTIAAESEMKFPVTTRKDLAVDDLVILVDESIPRHASRLARIIHVHTNGLHVRKATVKRRSSDKRSYKIVKLELDNNITKPKWLVRDTIALEGLSS